MTLPRRGEQGPLEKDRGPFVGENGAPRGEDLAFAGEEGPLKGELERPCARGDTWGPLRAPGEACVCVACLAKGLVAAGEGLGGVAAVRGSPIESLCLGERRGVVAAGGPR